MTCTGKRGWGAAFAARLDQVCGNPSGRGTLPTELSVLFCSSRLFCYVLSIFCQKKRLLFFCSVGFSDMGDVYVTFVN
jgi:hypothetical protein